LLRDLRVGVTVEIFIHQKQNSCGNNADATLNVDECCFQMEQEQIDESPPVEVIPELNDDDVDHIPNSAGDEHPQEDNEETLDVAETDGKDETEHFVDQETVVDDEEEYSFPTPSSLRRSNEEWLEDLETKQKPRRTDDGRLQTYPPLRSKEELFTRHDIVRLDKLAAEVSVSLIF
jgi:hypothetical protein